MRCHAPFYAIAVSCILVLAACGAEDGTMVPADDVRSKIESTIHAQGDSLALEDPRTGEPVILRFDHVHEEVEATAGGRWVACVDYVDPDGTVWDIDYYVDDTAAGEYRIEDIVIHAIGDETVLPDDARARLEAAG